MNAALRWLGVRNIANAQQTYPRICFIIARHRKHLEQTTCTGDARVVSGRPARAGRGRVSSGRLPNTAPNRALWGPRQPRPTLGEPRPACRTPLLARTSLHSLGGPDTVKKKGTAFV